MVNQTEEVFGKPKQVGIGSVSSARPRGAMGSISPTDATNALDVLAEDNPTTQFDQPKEKETESSKPITSPKLTSTTKDLNPPVTTEMEEIAEEAVSEINQSVPPTSSLRPKARPDKRLQSAVRKIIELGYIQRREASNKKEEELLEGFDSTFRTVTNLTESKNLKTITKFITQALGAEDPNLDVTKEGVYWCAAFVNHILTEMGADTLGKGDRYNRLRAKKYINYGEEVSLENMQEGDILLFGQGDEVSHVGFYTGERSGNTVNMMGGNQFSGAMDASGNSIYEVNSVPRSLGNIIGVRRVTYQGDSAKIAEDQKEGDSIFNYFDTPNYEAKFNPSSNRRYAEGGLSSQTEEALGWAAEGKNLAVDIPEVSLRDAATFVAEMTPIVGDAMAAKEVYDELQKDEPNYYLAGALGGAALVGLVPGLGDVAAKAIKKGAKEVFDVARRVEVDPNAMGSGLGNVKLKPKDDERIPIRPINQSRLEASGLPYKQGGEFTDARTKEILTNKNASSVNIKVKTNEPPKGGMPQASMDAAGLDAEEIGSSGPKIYSNLVKPTSKGGKAGWKWLSRKDENLDTNTLVSVVQRNQHYFTLEADFSKGAKLQTYPNKVDEPRLRPTVNGQLEFDEEVGTISLRGKEHPVYRKIIAFNKGGPVMNNQMEMAFMKQGGIKDDGMNKDPVSGNPIPPGSMAKEVRDDIPAMLSEGEYVVPADVLRFYGVNFFEDLRGKAKQGLNTMEQNGRIGGEPLSPQQVQQNMGKPPQVGQPAPMPVQANAGVYMAGQPQGLQQSQTSSQNFNPMDYPIVGGSTLSGGQESVTTFKTFVNSVDGRTQIVEFVNGKIKNKTMEKFTQPPYFEQGSSALKDAKKAAAQPTSSGGGGGGGGAPTPEPPDPNEWASEITDPMAWANENLQGKANTILSTISLGTSVARVNAMAIVAEAQNKTDLADQLRTKAREFVAANPVLNSIPNAWIDGDRIAADLQKDNNIVSTLFAPKARKKQMEVAKATPEFDVTKSVAPDDDSGNFLKTIMDANKAAKDAGKTEVSSTITNAGTAEQEVSGGTQAEQDYLTSAAAGNKGGLMMKKNSKKK